MASTWSIALFPRISLHEFPQIPDVYGAIGVRCLQENTQVPGNNRPIQMRTVPLTRQITIAQKAIGALRVTAAGASSVLREIRDWCPSGTGWPTTTCPVRSLAVPTTRTLRPTVSSDFR